MLYFDPVGLGVLITVLTADIHHASGSRTVIRVLAEQNTMSGNNRDNHIIEIEDSASTEDYHLTGKGRKDGYEQRFESILKGQFEDRKTWWDAVEKLQEMDDDFATKASCYSAFDPHMLHIAGLIASRGRTHAGYTEVAMADRRN